MSKHPRNPYAPNHVTLRVRWHAEGAPHVTVTDQMCDYHFRVAKSCLMVEEVFSVHVCEEGTTDCFFCRLPESEV